MTSVLIRAAALAVLVAALGLGALRPPAASAADDWFGLDVRSTPAEPWVSTSADGVTSDSRFETEVHPPLEVAASHADGRSELSFGVRNDPRSTHLAGVTLILRGADLDPELDRRLRFTVLADDVPVAGPERLAEVLGDELTLASALAPGESREIVIRTTSTEAVEWSVGFQLEVIGRSGDPVNPAEPADPGDPEPAADGTVAAAADGAGHGDDSAAGEPDGEPDGALPTAGAAVGREVALAGVGAVGLAAACLAAWARRRRAEGRPSRGWPDRKTRL
ncbi:MAG: hypothetical protein LBR33_11980 [Propionibacteriaceae bacterium]|jgi:hypothetical protein|nr:hypothetical protein [Propionibacteriaceae bacterium]